MSGFHGLGLAPKLLEALEKLSLTIPTPIQEQAIPVAVEGKDVMGIAQTGTGKTLAFALPMIQRLAQNPGSKGLILLPTRELALQVDETLQKIGRAVSLRTAVLIGGASMHAQLQALRHRPHVIVATPGRLIDHLENRSMDLSSVGVLVLDEADRMLDMGFAPQLKRILQTVPRERQTLLFSATMPAEIVHLATAYMHLPIRVEIARAGTAAEHVTHELFFVERSEKPRLLEKVLSDYRGSVLVFSRTKHGARKLCRTVKVMGHSAAELHSDRSLAQRRHALDGFRSGLFRVLVATDIAARGIDVKGIELVINYDLPDQAEDYVHRIGRTGRAGLTGHTISFATPDQKGDVRMIERLIRKVLPVSPLPPLPAPRVIPHLSSDDDQPRPYGYGSARHTHARDRDRASGYPPRRADQRRTYSAHRGPSSTPSGSHPRPSGPRRPPRVTY